MLNYKFSFPITALSGIKNVICQCIKNDISNQRRHTHSNVRNRGFNCSIKKICMRVKLFNIEQKCFNSVNHNSKASHSIQNDFITKHVHAWLSKTSSAFKSRGINRTIALVAAAIFCAVIATKFCCPNCTSVACLSSVP